MTSSDERAIEIIYKLKRKGYSQVRVAEIHGVTKQAVWNAIWSQSESLPLKKIIARILEEPIEALWPKEKDEKQAA